MKKTLVFLLLMILAGTLPAMAYSDKVEKLKTAGASGTAPVATGSGSALAMTDVATQAELDAYAAAIHDWTALQTYSSGGRPARTIVLTATGAKTKTTNGPALSSIDATNIEYKVLDYDDSTDETAWWAIELPDGFSAFNGLTINWHAAATSGNVVWAVQGVCIADAEVHDASMSTAQTVTDAAKGTTLQKNQAAISSLSFNGTCAAGETLHIKIFRDADNGSDTMSGDARLLNVRLEYLVAAESD